MVVRKKTWVGRWWDRLLVPPKKVKPMGLIAVQMSINPFELYLLIGLCIIGILYMIGLPPPSSVRTLLPDIAVKVWAANLGMGGLSALIGGLWQRNLERGLLAYQFGWVLIGIGSFVYGIALFILFPVAGAYPAVSNLLWALACLTRVVQVQRFFKLSEQMVLGGFRGPAGGLGSVMAPSAKDGERP